MFERATLKENIIKIHPAAVVAEEAEIQDGVEIGPYSIIGPDVRIGAGTRIGSHVVIEGHTTIGERCSIFHGACLGTPSQDKKSKDIKNSCLIIGNDNLIRENVTINLGTYEGSKTVLGDRNFIMIGSHIAHDCQVGSGVVLANGSMMGGHVTVEDGAVIGGATVIHQFVRVGKFAMIGGASRVVMDIPPFSLCDGRPARFYGINAVGLRRAGYSSQDRTRIKNAYRILFMRSLRLVAALEELKKQFRGSRDIEHLVSFMEHSKRGVCRPRGGRKVEDVVE